MVFGSVHAFAALPGSCHALFVQLCVVYSKMAIFCFALLLLISFLSCCALCFMLVFISGFVFASGLLKDESIISSQRRPW